MSSSDLPRQPLAGDPEVDGGEELKAGEWGVCTARAVTEKQNKGSVLAVYLSSPFPVLSVPCVTSPSAPSRLRVYRSHMTAVSTTTPHPPPSPTTHAAHAETVLLCNCEQKCTTISEKCGWRDARWAILFWACQAKARRVRGL